MTLNHYKTIVVSDVHLGTKDSKAKELVRFLKKSTCETLILNGDIIDGWRLKRGGKWKKKHTRFFRLIFRLIEKTKTRVIYVRGNHDDFLDHLIPFDLGNLSIVKEYSIRSNGKKLWVVHGDIFDSVTSNMAWLAKLGDVGYTMLLWLNKIYNNWRIKRGLPYYSLSKVIKAKVKQAVSYISDYEKELVAFAQKRHFDGVICGHIHHPAIIDFKGIMYYNSGDWVESLSALVEDFDGNWSIMYYSDFLEQEKMESKLLITND